MRFIVISKSDKKVKSIADIPFDYDYPIDDGCDLVIGYEDYAFNLMSHDYIFSGDTFTEVAKL